MKYVGLSLVKYLRVPKVGLAAIFTMTANVN